MTYTKRRPALAPRSKDKRIQELLEYNTALVLQNRELVQDCADLQHVNNLVERRIEEMVHEAVAKDEAYREIRVKFTKHILKLEEELGRYAPEHPLLTKG